MKKCPSCAEEIREEAIRCRYCCSRVVWFRADGLHRDQPHKQIGGVASAVAEALAVPLFAVRAAFVVLTFVHLLGPLLYGLGLLLIPARAGGPSFLESGVERIASLTRSPESGKKRTDDPAGG